MSSTVEDVESILCYIDVSILFYSGVGTVDIVIQAKNNKMPPKKKKKVWGPAINITGTVSPINQIF